MKKSSAKKSSLKKSNKNHRPKVTWFGIDIYRIGLGVAFVGAIVSFLLVKQQQSLQEQQTQVLAAENHMPIMMPGFEQNATLSARPTCIPRPVGFNPIAASASGKYKSILSRICPPTTKNGTSSGEIKYRGCKIEITCSPTSTAKANGHCIKQIVCPSGTPFPAMTCVPRPPCLDNQNGPKCLIAEPTGGWCLSITKTPEPTCGPQPTCGDGQVCPSPEDTNWCHHEKNPMLMQQVQITSSPTTGMTIMTMPTNLAQLWNNFLRKLIGR